MTSDLVRQKFAERIISEPAPYVARETGPIMPVDVRDVGGGFAFVRVNKRVRFDTALKILTAINDDIRQDLDDERIPDNG